MRQPFLSTLANTLLFGIVAPASLKAQVLLSGFKSKWAVRNCAKEYNRSVGHRVLVASGEKMCVIVDKAPSLEFAEEEAMKMRLKDKRLEECKV